MTSPKAAYLLKPGDDGYGRICGCGAPKHRQSKRCRACYTDLQRNRHAGAIGQYDGCACGKRKLRESVRCASCYAAARRRGEAGPRGRSQTQSHPWRGKNRLLFAQPLKEAAFAGGNVGASSSGHREGLLT